jgi:PAS domain S-box-containing protein
MCMKKYFRNSGIEIIGDITCGTHFCQFYQTKKDLIDILIPYFKAGLENNEFCFWVTSQPLEADDAKKALREAVPDFSVYLEKGQIEIVSYISWCVNEGIYDSERKMNCWFEKLNHAIENGYEGLRLAENTSWLKKEEGEDYIDFEKKVDSNVDKYPIIALCSYPLRKCVATKIIDIIINHHFALIKRKGKWEMIESSKRKKAQEKIKTLANAVESSDDAIVTESLEGIITSWNKGAEQIYGYSAQEILGKNVAILEPDNIKGEIKQLIEKIKQGEKIRHYETLRLKEDNALINVSVTLSPVFDTSGKLVAISSIGRDITERIKAEKLLTKAEDARKKEIHHRIKNNLQVICSLLDLQAEKFRDQKVLEAFRESQNRVLSMSLIHEELYKGEGSDTLDFSEYLQRLAENLFKTYSLNSKNICLNVDLEENAFFNMDTAVPLGIIVNELVSNSFKHAFTEDEAGEIRIQLCREEKSNETHMSFFSLTISDDGKGIPENIESGKLESLGLQLVNTLVDQLSGKIELKKAQGAEFKITFNAVERSLSPLN